MITKMTSIGTEGVLLRKVNLHDLSPLNKETSLASWWERSRKRLNKDNRKIFDSLVVAHHLIPLTAA